MKIVGIVPGSIAKDLGLQPGDDLLEVNGKRIRDGLDLRFHEGDETLTLKAARDGQAAVFEIEKDEEQGLGIELEELKVLSCGNDCIFCFVDQNPKGLRQQLYFRDGDYRMSFMYGNYTTLTNAGPATLQRIVEQRLSPQYISVHVTDDAIRRRLMGLRKDDHILEKIAFLHDHGIAMHTQIVLCPGINDGAALEKTVHDLYRFQASIISLALVPVGLTDHRFGLADLHRVDREYAGALLDTVAQWQDHFRADIGRAFVYPSDEFTIVAGRPLPPARFYDGFPQTENGVGMVRHFLGDLAKQACRLPPRLPAKKTLLLVTGTLASGFMEKEVLPRLNAINGLTARLVTAPNTLFGPSVTVAGLLSGKCVYSAVKEKEHGDMLLLPPDILNADGLFLDDSTVSWLEQQLGMTVAVFTGSWRKALSHLMDPKRRARSRTLVPVRNPHSQLAYTTTKG
jgi:putative radical SAM enzyme (TIGR03279 family)